MAGALEAGLLNSFKEKGYKITEQRMTVLDVLAENEGRHLDVEEIYGLVKVKSRKIGLSTVYRTLMLMNELGIVSRLDSNQESGKYELNRDGKGGGHPHLICVKCGSILEAHEEIPTGTVFADIFEKYNFQADEIRIHLYGICPDCLDKS